MYRSIDIPKTQGVWKKMFAFFGPGLLIAVGYMDPGNWATDIAGGAQFAYALLFVILLSNIFAMILQHLALKLGIATGLDLAQACRAYYSPVVNYILWFLCEIAIIACDLAEVIGSAIALNLLFDIPMTIGVLITTADVLLLLLLQDRKFRLLEVLVGLMILVILFSFITELFYAKPDIQLILRGLLPTSEILSNPKMLYIAIGIMGATVMPHNLYLHSSIVKTRNIGSDAASKKEAIKFATWDSSFCLFIAFFINAAILILAAGTFYVNGYHEIQDLKEAHKLLNPLLGVEMAGFLFALALLASGQNSTITGTMAGQIVMEGFLNLKIKPWVRRLITRLLAIIPALYITYYFGDAKTVDMLIFSQVVLSIQLSFAVIPLVYFTSNRVIMGQYVNTMLLKLISWVIALLIISLNLWMMWTQFL